MIDRRTGPETQRERSAPNERRIVKGQNIAPTKRELAARLRSKMTPAEKKLWDALRRKHVEGLRFRRQQIIDGFVADFYCPGAGLVIEVDGRIHAGQVDYDRERDRIIEARRLAVLRFTNEQVMGEINLVLQEITAVCQRRVTEASEK